LSESRKLSGEFKESGGLACEASTSVPGSAAGAAALLHGTEPLATFYFLIIRSHFSSVK